jgi:folate-binding protein YgfZ
MGLTALQRRGEGLGASFAAYATGEYCGATTAARFGDPQQEWAELRSGCGVYDLGYRAKILLKGTDRVRWLNGMVTNNIRDLAADQGVYAFLLNPQGHILGDLYAYNRGESGVSSSGVSPSILVDTDCAQAEKIVATFDHYIIMDDVEVTNLSEVTALGIGGPKSREVMERAGVAVPEMKELQLQSAMWNGIDCTLVRGEDPASVAYEIWIGTDHVREVWDALRSAGAMPVGSEALELRRIVAGIPRYGVDIRERDLPQETEQARALNFNKGCYVGQEIVERIRSRGAVHRKFSGFVADGAAELAAGTKIIAADKEAGEVTSAAIVQFAGGEKTVALGYIRREVGVPGREVTIGGNKAMVAQLPIEESTLASGDDALARHTA